MAACEWLQIHKPDFYHDGIFNLMPRWDKHISVLGSKIKNNDSSMQKDELHSTL